MKAVLAVTLFCAVLFAPIAVLSVRAAGDTGVPRFTDAQAQTRQVIAEMRRMAEIQSALLRGVTPAQREVLIRENQELKSRIDSMLSEPHGAAVETSVLTDEVRSMLRSRLTRPWG